MAEEPEGIVLRYVRRIDERLDRIDVSLTNLVSRVASVEEQVAGLRKDFVRLEMRVGQMDDRMKRIERRLDLVQV
jgi:predicted  nucleic acid-binding Zn-ribbon protein